MMTRAVDGSDSIQRHPGCNHSSKFQHPFSVRQRRWLTKVRWFSARISVAVRSQTTSTAQPPTVTAESCSFATKPLNVPNQKQRHIHAVYNVPKGLRLGAVVQSARRPATITRPVVVLTLSNKRSNMPRVHPIGYYALRNFPHWTRPCELLGRALDQLTQ